MSYFTSFLMRMMLLRILKFLKIAIKGFDKCVWGAVKTGYLRNSSDQNSHLQNSRTAKTRLSFCWFFADDSMVTEWKWNTCVEMIFPAGTSNFFSSRNKRVKSWRLDFVCDLKRLSSFVTGIMENECLIFLCSAFDILTTTIVTLILLTKRRKSWWLKEEILMRKHKKVIVIVHPGKVDEWNTGMRMKLCD